MEGRPIRGDGIDHEQDYIQERLEQASDTDEYAEAAEVLEDHLQDLRSGSAQAGSAGDASTEALQRQVVTPTDRDELRREASREADTLSQIDLNQQPPEAEARTRTASSLGGGAMGEGTSSSGS